MDGQGCRGREGYATAVLLAGVEGGGGGAACYQDLPSCSLARRERRSSLVVTRGGLTSILGSGARSTLQRPRPRTRLWPRPRRQSRQSRCARRRKREGKSNPGHVSLCEAVLAQADRAVQSILCPARRPRRLHPSSPSSSPPPPPAPRPRQRGLATRLAIFLVPALPVIHPFFFPFPAPAARGANPYFFSLPPLPHSLLPEPRSSA